MPRSRAVSLLATLSALVLGAGALQAQQPAQQPAPQPASAGPSHSVVPRKLARAWRAATVAIKWGLRARGLESRDALDVPHHGP